MIKLPSQVPPPPPLDYSAEGQYIRFFNEAIWLANHDNTQLLEAYQHACDFWLQNYPAYLNNKLPIPPKPTSPVGYIVDIVNGAPQAVLSAEPVGDPCPDPAPGPQTPPPPVDPVGEAFGGAQPWYRVVTGDTTPVGGIFTDARGTFKRASHPTPFGNFQYWVLES
jgi:hypothetical protein